MGHYHSYEAEAKGLGTTVLDFTEEELRLDNRKPPNPQNNAGNISLRGNNDDVGSRHLHDYSLAYSEVYTKKDPHINRTNNSIRTNLHDQKPEEVHNPAKKKQREVRDINKAIQFAEDIQYLRLEANNTTNLNNNTMIVFNIPPIHEQLFLERQRGGPGMTFSDRYNKFLGEFEVTLDTFEHAQKKIKIHEISDNPKFKGDPQLLYSRFAAEEKSFHASRNKSDSRLEMSHRDRHETSQRDRLEMSHRDRHEMSQRDRLEMSHRDRHEMSQRDRLEMSQRDHPLNASIYSDKKSKTQVASEHSHEKSLNQSQMQNSSPYSRDQTKYHTFKADNNNYDAYSSQKNEDSHLESQRSPQNPFYDHNTSLLKKSPERPEKIEEHQITPRSSANKKVQVGGSLNQSLSQSQIRQSQTKTPPLTSQKVQQSQSKKMESSGSGHKSKKPVATTPQKHIPIVPSTAKTEVQDMQFQTPDSRTKTPPPRRTSPSPNTVQKRDKRSVSPNSGQKDSRIQYKSFWREGVRPKVVKKDTKRVPLKHESAKIKEGFETLAKTMKPNKLLNVNEKYVPLSQKKPQEQLFDRSHDYELVYVRPSIQKDQSPEPDNEQQQQQQSQRNSEKKKKIQKVTHADDNSKNKKKQTQENGNYDDYEEDEQENDEYQEQEEEEYYYEERDQQEDISLVEDEYMTERYEKAQRKKDGNYSNYGNNAEYVETSIDISSYLKNQQMPKFNQGKSSHQGNNYYENNQQEQEYEDEYQEQPEYYEREYELPSSQNDFRDQRHQQMRYAPKIRNKYTQERYEEDQGFDDHNYLHDILDRVRNLHDKMENSFSDITRDHSRIAEEDEDRPEEQKYSQFKRDPFHSARQDRYEQNEQVQNFPGSSKLKVSSKKLRPQGAR